MARTCFNDARFFIEECDNSTYEMIGRAILIGSVDQSLVAEMQALATCFAMYSSLLAKFKTSSRAAQMNIFYKFKCFKIDPEAPNAGIASSLKNLQAEWLAINVKLGVDAFLGFVLQSAVMDSNADYKKAFELRVEQLVQNDKQGRCPSFEQILLALDICKDQHKHATELALDGNPAFTSHTPPSALLASPVDVDTFDVSAFLADVDEKDWVDALDFYALTAHKCWQCGGENHYARSCPERVGQTQSGRPVGRPIGTMVGTIYGHLPSGVALESSCFPRTNFRRHQGQPSRNQEHARSLADHYRPRYQSNSQSTGQVGQGGGTPLPKAAAGGVAAHIMEVNDLPDDLDDLDFHSMALGEDLLPVEPDLLSQAWGH